MTKIEDILLENKITKLEKEKIIKDIQEGLKILFDILKNLNQR